MGEGKGDLSEERSPFPSPPLLFPSKDFRLVGRPRGRSSFQSGAGKPSPHASPLQQYPFNNKEPERIVQALLFAHREHGEKGFNKVESLGREGGRRGLGRGERPDGGPKWPYPLASLRDLRASIAELGTVGVLPPSSERFPLPSPIFPLLDGSPNPVQTDVAEAVGGPVDAPRLAANVIAVEEPPETGIRRIVAVVAEREKLVGGHGDRPPVVAARNHDERLRMLGVGLLHFDAVAVQNLVPHLQRIAGDAHDALDVVEAPILGVTEDDDVADFGLDAADQILVVEGVPEAVEELVDQQMIADLEENDDVQKVTTNCSLDLND